MMEEIIKAIKQTKNEIGNKEVECEWREFLLSEIFDIQHGNGFDKNKMTFNNPKINFISRTRENNGFLCKVDLITTIKPYKSGLITMSLIGEGRGACFIQNDPFYTTQNMLVLNPKSNLITNNVKLFLIQRITYTARTIYDAYTNTLHGNIDKFLINLPTKNNKPDFEMMEKIIVDLKNKMKISAIAERERESKKST